MKYMMKSLGERKLTFVKSLSFFFSVLYRYLLYPIQDRLGLLISKSVSHNFAETFLAMLICL